MCPLLKTGTEASDHEHKAKKVISLHNSVPGHSSEEEELLLSSKLLLACQQIIVNTCHLLRLQKVQAEHVWLHYLCNKLSTSGRTVGMCILMASYHDV